MASKDAQAMLEALAHTANTGAYAAHMDLISKEVSVYGVPGFDVIGYADWARQCKFEFDEGVLKQVSYEGLRVVSDTPDNVLFKTIETVEGTDGKINCQGVEILIRAGASNALVLPILRNWRRSDADKYQVALG